MAARLRAGEWVRYQHGSHERPGVVKWLHIARVAAHRGHIVEIDYLETFRGLAARPVRMSCSPRKLARTTPTEEEEYLWLMARLA